MDRLIETRLQDAIDTLEAGGVALIPAEDVPAVFAMIDDGALSLTANPEPPLCNYCHTRHYGYQDHDMA